MNLSLVDIIRGRYCWMPSSQSSSACEGMSPCQTENSCETLEVFRPARTEYRADRVLFSPFSLSSRSTPVVPNTGGAGNWDR